MLDKLLMTTGHNPLSIHSHYILVDLRIQISQPDSTDHYRHPEIRKKKYNLNIDPYNL